jgi:hypothetical protein
MPQEILLIDGSAQLGCTRATSVQYARRRGQSSHATMRAFNAASVLVLAMRKFYFRMLAACDKLGAEEFTP